MLVVAVTLAGGAKCGSVVGCGNTSESEASAVKELSGVSLLFTEDIDTVCGNSCLLYLCCADDGVLSDQSISVCTWRDARDHIVVSLS